MRDKLGIKHPISKDDYDAIRARLEQLGCTKVEFGGVTGGMLDVYFQTEPPIREIEITCEFAQRKDA